MNMEKIRREEIRWRILKVLDSGRPAPVPESLALRVMGDVKLGVTPSELRREIDYLEARQLVEVTKNDEWLCELTRVGIDVVEYTVPCDPGIARPEQH